MPRRRTNPPLRVFINSRPVGVLTRTSSGAIDFSYDRTWLEWDSAFPVSLSLPLREDRYIGAPVVSVFDNLLPDSDPIRRRIAERAGAEGTDAYSMLAKIGHDCAGALQFLPDGVEPGPAGGTEGRPVSDDDIGEIIRNLAAAPLGMDEDDDFRISVAGAQEKTALLRKDGQWYKPSGTAATTHLFKPQIGELPNGIDLSNSVENEYLCLMLLAALGISSAKAEIADFGGRRTLVVERFDRRWTRDGRLLRLPQEDTCQALSIPPTQKYQRDGGPGLRDIFELLKGSDDPGRDIAAFMRASVVFWLLGATDGHAKNFSIFLMPGARYRMTPLYDVLSAQPSLDAGQIVQRQFRLAMSVGRNNHYRMTEIMPRHFMQTAEISGVGKPLVQTVFADLAENAVSTAERALDSLPPGFPAELTDSILGGIRDRVNLLQDDRGD